jgi:hypothetical protein
MALVSYFHDLSADPIQNASEQSLGAISKFDIPDFSPETAEKRNERFSMPTQELALPPV